MIGFDMLKRGGLDGRVVHALEVASKEVQTAEKDLAVSS